PKVSYLIKSNLIATFFNQFLPSTVGGDTVRAYDSWRLGKKKADAVSVIFIDRFLGILVLLLFASITVFFAEPITSKVPFLHYWVMGSGLLALFAILFVFFPNKKIFEPFNKIPIPIVRKINQKILKLADSLWQFRNHKKVLINAFLLSILLQANVVFYYFLISHSLIFGISFIYFFLMVPISIFIMMLPISINGIGLRENIFFIFLSNFSIHASEAVAFAWIEFLFIIILGLIGGLVYAFRK
ncbi:MAG: lysylphosphatidylglycerol synthase transmembrane domain-containing protein, partial [Ignavibacteriaceae bacterium]